MRQELSDAAFEGGPTIIAVARALARHRDAAVVHVHMTAAEIAAVLTLPLTRARLVSTRHFPARRGRGAARLIAPLVRRTVALELAISQYVADNVGQHARVLAPGVPRAPESSRASLTVLVAQRLEQEKATDLALRSWSAARLDANGWRLVVAGSGSQHAALRRLAAELNVLESVRFVGNVSDLDALLNEAAVFLAPTPVEAFGLGVVEAMARGLPVVAAAAGGHLETVATATPDLVFPPGDAEACAQALRSVCLDGDLRDIAGARNRAFQHEHFDIESHVDSLAEVYREVVTRGA